MATLLSRVAQVMVARSSAPALASTGQGERIVAIHSNRSGRRTELENAINAQAALGYRLHTISTASSGSTSLSGADRSQATMVFQRLN